MSIQRRVHFSAARRAGLMFFCHLPSGDIETKPFLFILVVSCIEPFFLHFVNETQSACISCIRLLLAICCFIVTDAARGIDCFLYDDTREPGQSLIPVPNMDKPLIVCRVCCIISCGLVGQWDALVKLRGTHADNTALCPSRFHVGNTALCPSRFLVSPLFTGLIIRSILLVRFFPFISTRLFLLRTDRLCLNVPFCEMFYDNNTPPPNAIYTKRTFRDVPYVFGL